MGTRPRPEKNDTHSKSVTKQYTICRCVWSKNGERSVSAGNPFFIFLTCHISNNFYSNGFLHTVYLGFFSCCCRRAAAFSFGWTFPSCRTIELGCPYFLPQNRHSRRAEFRLSNWYFPRSCGRMCNFSVYSSC